MTSSKPRHHTSAFAAFAVASLSMGCASAGPTPPTTTAATANASARDQQEGQKMNAEIKTLVQTYQRSLNEANVDLVGSVYADDAVFVGQPFPTATGKAAIVALYADFLSKLDFNVEFEILEIELGEDLGFVRTRSRGTIVPKGQKPEGSEGSREVFVVKKIAGAWKFYRYIFNPEV
ncbi:MAG: nuclear transport factor 2 family protein [Deltaproteobacteria bacterium]|jgi:uncharacterized protein (TIGR02246 family)|nr:nuclear transport factor 2 family protein [Deltaproteobacteria bacterium]